MKKAVALKIINILLAVLMLNQGLTGLLHDRLPEEAFEAFHITGAILLVAGTILHLALNWSWIKAMYLRKKGASKS
jgi:hypothetical protein